MFMCCCWGLVFPLLSETEYVFLPSIHLHSLYQRSRSAHPFLGKAHHPFSRRTCKQQKLMSAGQAKSRYISFYILRWFHLSTTFSKFRKDRDPLITSLSLFSLCLFKHTCVYTVSMPWWLSTAAPSVKDWLYQCASMRHLSVCQTSN